jgi:hypothetical protein
MTRFPRWVPQSVKGKIADLQSSDLSAESREALERLATRDEMRGVWTKLPPESDPGDTILWFITAFVLAQGLEPPRPKDGMTLMEHIHLHWKPDCLGLAVLARPCSTRSTSSDFRPSLESDGRRLVPARALSAVC